MLPDQYTGEALRSLIESYEARFAELQRPGPVVDVVSVRGGRVVTTGGGAVEVLPDVSISAEYRLVVLAPVVELTYSGIPARAEPYRIVTTPARLVTKTSVGEEQTEHLVRAHGGLTTVAFVANTTPFLASSPDPALPRLDLVVPCYDIPPAATHIRGTGELRYATGHVVPVGEASQTIGRPDATGALAVRPGAVYAKFYGTQPAHVRIGYAWFETTPSA